jgi:hypothetical protein
VLIRISVAVRSAAVRDLVARHDVDAGRQLVEQQQRRLRQRRALTPASPHAAGHRRGGRSLKRARPVRRAAPRRAGHLGASRCSRAVKRKFSITDPRGRPKARRT